MALETYRQKRDFTKTQEPKGGTTRKAGNSFVIQKHAATRLHYDFRLEMGGVLKSWAVTRGPSLNVNDKRLAVHVEDHPLEYGGFEGTIPKGEYGGGIVILWDRGTWKPISDADKGYAKGHLEFELKAKKLGGRWHLVRMQGKHGSPEFHVTVVKTASGGLAIWHFHGAPMEAWTHPCICRAARRARTSRCRMCRLFTRLYGSCVKRPV